MTTYEQHLENNDSHIDGDKFFVGELSTSSGALIGSTIASATFKLKRTGDMSGANKIKCQLYDSDYVQKGSDIGEYDPALLSDSSFTEVTFNTTTSSAIATGDVIGVSWDNGASGGGTAIIIRYQSTGEPFDDDLTYFARRTNDPNPRWVEDSAGDCWFTIVTGSGPAPETTTVTMPPPIAHVRL